MTRRATLFAKPIEDTEKLVVPVITSYEVFKKVLRERGENPALRAASLMQMGQLIEVDLSLVLSAAQHALPLADSLVYATARRHKATLWTQDAHFEGLPGVRYFSQ